MKALGKGTASAVPPERPNDAALAAVVPCSARSISAAGKVAPPTRAWRNSAESKEYFMIQFKQEICGDLDAASRREWLESNGLGGFASSTIAGLNTRRYHGLLVAATKPPLGRMVLLSKLEETLVIDGRRFELSANRYPGVVHPQGYLFLKQFRQDPFPVLVYEVEGLQLEKSIFMIQGENATVIQYELHGHSSACILELRPLIAFRDYHS